MRLIPLLFALCLVTPVAAQTLPPAASAPATVSPPLAARANEMIAILNGTGDYDGYFSPGFRAQVPRAKFDAVTAQLTAAMGKALKVDRITPIAAAAAGTVRVAYEKGFATVRLIVDPVAPNQVTGLLLTGTELIADDLSKLEQDFRTLPGQAGFGIYALSDTAPPRPVKELAGATPAPIGSAFKLWVLAEAARQVKAGMRRWADVVAIGPHSLASGVTQDWPAGAPVTLHTLATLMISISDNTATDTLMTTLGRGHVDAMVARAGTADPGATLPLLTTREAFALKAAANADLVTDWAALGAQGRARRMRDDAARIAGTAMSVAIFGDGQPTAQQVEWFASPRDMAATLDWIRRAGEPQALAILAINPGTHVSDGVDYIGFKGGSEPGVIALNFLIRKPSGAWLAVVGNWHRPDAVVDAGVFTGLMDRAIRLAVRG